MGRDESWSASLRAALSSDSVVDGHGNEISVPSSASAYRRTGRAIRRYFVKVLADLGIAFPAAISAAPGTVLVDPAGASVTAVFNLPAVLIALLVTALLVRGVRESATVNGVMVAVKVAVVCLVIAAGLPFVDSGRFTPLVPPNTGTFGEFGWSGVMRGAAVIFFAYIGFDAVSTAAQEARNLRRDMPIGILGSLSPLVPNRAVAVGHRVADADVEPPWRNLDASDCLDDGWRGDLLWVWIFAQ